MRGLVILLGALACWSAAESADAAPRSAASSQAVQAQNERAREKFRLGVNAFRAERLEEARQLLSEAWRLRRTYDVAASLAQVEHELGHHAQAAELLDFCLNNFAPIESDTKFQQLQQVFEEVRGRVGQIDISTLPADTEIAVDDRPFVTAALAAPMYLEPGLHEFAIKVGGKLHHRSLLVQAGAQHRLELAAPVETTSATPARPVAPGAPTSNAAAPTTAARPTFPYYLGGALLVAGVTTAVVFQVAASDAKSRRQELSTQPGVSDCSVKGATSTALCSDIADAAADYQFNRNLAVFGYGVAATAAIATTIYWLWPEPASSAKVARHGASISVDYASSRLWIGATGAF